MNPSVSRADLHVHTRHSARAADWLLRRLDFPASMSDPGQTARSLRAAGMDFVTFTDHDTIAGCAEIADRPGAFHGEEVTATFPEDECKVHILVWGHTAAQHDRIQALRGNIYDLQGYLAAEDLTHAVAHPLHSPDEKLDASHMRKLVLLFRHFEIINGHYPAILDDTMRFALSALTPERIAEFSNQTGLGPTHEEPWKKILVAGSDDHAGLALGHAWTETPPARDAAEFLAHIRAGRCQARGASGTPLKAARGTYRTAFEFLKKKFSFGTKSPGAGLVEKAVSRFLEGKDPTEFTLGEKLGFLAQGIATGKIFEIVLSGNTTFWKELAAWFSKPEVKEALAQATGGVRDPERRTFLMANLIASRLGYRFFTQFLSQISTGKWLESIQTISPLVPLAALLSPYIHAMRLPRRESLRSIAGTLAGELPESLRNTRRAWFTDTLDDVNGVATTIRKMTAVGAATGHDIRVITSRAVRPDFDIPIENFPPVGEFELPEYELQSLSFPPALLILDHLIERNYSEIIISTPGPLGLTALYAAKTLGLRSVGIYHTDFPQYVRILTDDSFMETLTWNYMHWFYSQLDVIYVNSEDYRKSWIARGIPAEKLRILPRGLDGHLFHPSRRDPDFWTARGLRPGELGMLYVGRVSKEKNLDAFVAVARRLAQGNPAVRPLIVGDGPYLREMRRLLPEAIFTGYLSGETLAAAYASADFFLFPSTTDTFGNVILEAQASGLPVIVSDVGGPRDLVTHGEEGFITRALDVGDLCAAAKKLVQDSELRARMSRAARARVSDRDWTRAFEDFWAESPE